MKNSIVNSGDFNGQVRQNRALEILAVKLYSPDQ